jgi:hypothetical protein
MSSVQDFYREFTNLGIARRYNFELININNLDGFNKVAVFSAKIPGKKINTTKVPYGAFEFNVPTNATFPDNLSWSLTFASDSKQFNRTVYEEWQNTVYNFENGTGDVDFKKYTIKLGLLPDPTTKISPTAISNGEIKPIKIYTLYGCMPLMLDNVEYNVTDLGQDIVKFTVTLGYQYFKTEPPQGYKEWKDAQRTQLSINQVQDTNNTVSTDSSVHIDVANLRK